MVDVPVLYVFGLYIFFLYKFLYYPLIIIFFFLDKYDEKIDESYEVTVYSKDSSLHMPR